MKDFLAFLRSRVFLIQLGLALVCVIILGFAILQWLKVKTNHGNFVEVPDFSKLSVMEMRALADDSDLQYVVLDSTNYNPEFPKFSILEQNPKPGAKVKRNRKIYFTINPSGYKKVSLPDVIQITLRNATSRLKAVGLEVQRVSYIDEIGKDMVYYVKFKGKDIKPGDRLPKASKVELVCGRGEVAIIQRSLMYQDSLSRVYKDTISN